MERNEKIVVIATGFIIGASTAVFAIAKIRKNRTEKNQDETTTLETATETPNV